MRAMKDSGIEWIGQIPQEWKTIRLRSQFSFGKGLPITKADLTESGVAVISYGQIHSKANTGTTIKTELIRYVDPQYLTTNESSVVTNGDFIFADTSEDISGCGNCVYVDVDYPLFAGYHTMILRPENETSTKYYSYLFATDAWRSQIRAQASGVKLFSITQKMLRDTLLIEPSEEEKNRIVEYLDDKCAAIDTLIAAKEKTNALLKERRQSIIYEAVTKGLNPDAPMKDSGIEWIGQIPEHWGVGKLGYFIEAFNGDRSSNYPSGNDIQDSGVPFLTSSNLERDVLDMSNSKYISEEKYKSMSGLKMELDDIIYCLRGSVGKCAINKTETCGTVASSLMGIRCKKMIPDYLLFLLKSSVIETQNALFMNGTCAANLSAENVCGYLVPIPNEAEQRKIAEYLRGRCSEMDELISANEATIQKLKEYRQSIIYEAVTGKIEI